VWLEARWEHQWHDIQTYEEKLYCIEGDYMGLGRMKV